MFVLTKSLTAPKLIGKMVPLFIKKTTSIRDNITASQLLNKALLTLGRTRIGIDWCFWADFQDQGKYTYKRRSCNQANSKLLTST